MNDVKRKVLVTIYNSAKIGGPNVSMRNVENSFLSEKYSFREIIIDDRLGKKPRLNVLRRLVREIKDFRPDVIYVSGLQLHGFYMTIAAWIAGFSKRTILIVHGSACDDLSIGRINSFLFRYILEPVTVRLSAITYTVCQEMANNPIVKYNARFFGGVIHNAAPSYNLSIINRDGFRMENNFSDSDILVVYTGRIEKDKGLNYLVSAFEKMPSHIKLILVGDGSFVNILKEQAELCNSSNIFFLGSRKDIPEILFACDIFAFPSLHENLPNSIVEACTVGLPVIATDVGGNGEVIEDGYNGFIIPVRDSELIRQSIIKLASDRSLRIRMGENGKRKIKEEFSQEVLYPKIDDLFRMITN